MSRIDSPTTRQAVSLRAGDVGTQLACFTEIDMLHRVLGGVGVDVQQDPNATGHSPRNRDFAAAQEGNMFHSQTPRGFGRECRREIRRCRENCRDNFVELGNVVLGKNFLQQLSRCRQNLLGRIDLDGTGIVSSPLACSTKMRFKKSLPACRFGGPGGFSIYTRCSAELTLSAGEIRPFCPAKSANPRGNAVFSRWIGLSGEPRTTALPPIQPAPAHSARGPSGSRQTRCCRWRRPPACSCHNRRCRKTQD